MSSYSANGNRKRLHWSGQSLAGRRIPGLHGFRQFLLGEFLAFPDDYRDGPDHFLTTACSLAMAAILRARRCTLPTGCVRRIRLRKSMRASRTRKPTIDRRTIAYVRVSTEDQATTGVSLDAQEARVGVHCAAMGWDVSEVVRDAGESAKSLKRPGITQILERVRAGAVERIIVAKLDRLTRSIRDLSDLIDLCAKHDVALVSVAETLDTSSAAGRMVVNMLGVVGQWEREAIAERTSVALSHKRRSGLAYSTTPFGFRREGNALLPDALEQKALRKAIRMDGAGVSFRDIARFLTNLGVKPHRGKAWYASSVRAMLRSRMTAELTV
jgi:site-specific DNA recombinase